MSARTSAEITEAYVSSLRTELDRVGAVDAGDLVAEIRSLLTDAAGDDPARAEAEIARLGEPGELARGILTERGLDASNGVSPGVWWRLGIAAPIDIAVGLSLPLVVVLPAYVVALSGQPRAASIVIGFAMGVAALLWPLWVWRPWRSGGRTLSPGMTLMGLAVVRAPGSWRLVRTSELASLGLAPRRRLGLAIVIAVATVVLLAGVALVGLDFGGSWLASAAIEAEYSGATVGGGLPVADQLGSVIDEVYLGLRYSDGPVEASPAALVTPEAISELSPLRDRIAARRITSAQLGSPVQLSPGVYRVEVKELAGSAPVGSSTFTFGQRKWLREGGVGSDWVIVGIAVGKALTGK